MSAPTVENLLAFLDGGPRPTREQLEADGIDVDRMNTRIKGILDTFEQKRAALAEVKASGQCKEPGCKIASMRHLGLFPVNRPKDDPDLDCCDDHYSILKGLPFTKHGGI